MAHDNPMPSDWVRRWTPLIPRQGTVLDLACGRGRHLHWLASQGLSVLGVDRDPDALASAAAWGPTLLADLEQGAWPLAGQTFSGVVVTHYLWRATWPELLDTLAPGGVLIYETFSRQHAQIGKPSRDDFLLRPGELIERCADLRIVAYEDGFLPHPDRFIQRIVAVRENSPSASTTRYPLSLE
jgi:SAM-dependent methyltransferase